MDSQGGLGAALKTAAAAPSVPGCDTQEIFARAERRRRRQAAGALAVVAATAAAAIPALSLWPSPPGRMTVAQTGPSPAAGGRTVSPASLAVYDAARGTLTVTVQAATGNCRETGLLEAEERTDAVVLTATVAAEAEAEGFCRGVPTPMSVQATLGAPLGEREVRVAGSDTALEVVEEKDLFELRALPDGFRVATEFVDQGALVTTYTDGAGEIILTQGTAPRREAAGPSAAEPATVHGRPAVLRSYARAGGQPTERTCTWREGLEVTVIARGLARADVLALCEGSARRG